MHLRLRPEFGERSPITGAVTVCLARIYQVQSRMAGSGMENASSMSPLDVHGL